MKVLNLRKKVVENKRFGIEKNIFSIAGHKVDFIAPCGANKSIIWPPSRKKNVRHEKNIHFTRVVVTLALLGHQTSHSQNTFFSLVAQYTIH